MHKFFQSYLQTESDDGQTVATAKPRVDLGGFSSLTSIVGGYDYLIYPLSSPSDMALVWKGIGTNMRQPVLCLCLLHKLLSLINVEEILSKFPLA